MKNASFASLFILVVGNISHLFGPWWAVVVVAAVAILLFPMGPARALAVGTAAGSMLWWFNALWMNSSNTGMLAGKIGQVFQGVQALQLLAVTALLGGLLSGLGALIGAYGRTLLAPRDARRRRRARPLVPIRR